MECSERLGRHALIVLSAVTGLSQSACSAPSATPARPAVSENRAAQPAPEPESKSGARAVEPSGWTTREKDNRGPLCLSSDVPADPQRFVRAAQRPGSALAVAPGQALHAVFLGACLSSCERNAQVSCSVERQGSTLEAKLHVSYERNPDNGCTEAGACTGKVCSLPALEAGSYKLRYAHQTVAFEVPGSIAPPCLSGTSAP